MPDSSEISALFQAAQGQLTSEMAKDNEEPVLLALQRTLLALNGAGATYLHWMAHVTDAPRQSVDIQKRQVARLAELVKNAAVASLDPVTQKIAQDATAVQRAFVESGGQLDDVIILLARQSSERINESFAALLKGNGSWESFIEAVKSAAGIGLGFIPIVGDAISILREVVDYFQRRKVRLADANAYHRALRESAESYTQWSLFVEVLSELRIHPPAAPIASVDELLSDTRMAAAHATLKVRYEEILKSWQAP